MSRRVDDERRADALTQRLHRAEAMVALMRRIVELRRQGETPAEIGRRLGLHRKKLYRYLQTLQLAGREVERESEAP